MNFIPFFTSTEGIQKHFRKNKKNILRFYKNYSRRIKLAIITIVTATTFLVPTPSSGLFLIQGSDVHYAQTFSLQEIGSYDMDQERLPETPDRQPDQVVSVSATAYSSTVGQTDSSPFITASGTHVHDGTIAANFLAFGTKVKIPEFFGDKEFVVEDRMASRYNDRIDIWFPNTSQAISFGYKPYIEIEVYN